MNTTTQKVYITDNQFRVGRYAALACHREAILGGYITSLYFPSSHLFRKVGRGLPGNVGLRIEHQLSRRDLDGLDSTVVKTIPLPQLTRRAVRNVLPTGHAWTGFKLTRYTDFWFDKSASRRIPSDATIVYANEGAAQFSLEKGKSIGATTILEGFGNPAIRPAVLGQEFDRLDLTFDRRHFESRQADIETEIELADVIWTHSDYWAKTYANGAVDKKRIFAIPLGVDLSLFRPKTDAQSNEHKPLEILYVGQLSVLKGIARLLEAVSLFGPDQVRLKVIGPMQEHFLPAWERLVSPVRDRVIRLDPMPREKLAKHYQASDLLVLPSLGDSFGLVVLEAMASGTAVIVTDACGVPVRKGVDGIVVRSDDLEALPQAISKVLQDRSQLHEYGRNAAIQARTFTWERFQERFLEMLSLVSCKRHS